MCENSSVLELQSRCARQKVPHRTVEVGTVLNFQEDRVGIVAGAFHKAQGLKVCVVADATGELVDSDRIDIGIPFNRNERRGIDFILIAPAVFADHKARRRGGDLTVGRQQPRCQRQHLVTADHITRSCRNNTNGSRWNRGSVPRLVGEEGAR